MTDYLITRYNDKIQASRALMEDKISKATQLCNDTCAEIIGAWQADAVAAGIELQTEMDARNRAYVQGPPLEPERPESRPLANPPDSEADRGEPPMENL